MVEVATLKAGYCRLCSLDRPAKWPQKSLLIMTIWYV